MKKFLILLLFTFLAMPALSEDKKPAPSPKTDAKAKTDAAGKAKTDSTAKAKADASAKPADAKPKPKATPKPSDPNQFDNSMNQVRVRAKILEWRLENTNEYGISALYSKNLESGSILDSANVRLPMESNFPDASKSVGPGGRVFIDQLMKKYGNLGLVVEALEKEGKAKSLFAPNITLSADSQVPAKISTGSKVPYESTQIINNSATIVTKFRDVGITLEVKLLEIMHNNYVKIDMKTTVSSLTGNNISVTLDKYENPILVPEISTKSMNNVLLLGDKEVFITGILKSQTKFSRDTGVPWIVDIPVIKYLFKNSFKKSGATELIFMVSPEIIRMDKGANQK